MTIAFNTLDSKLACGDYFPYTQYPSDSTAVNPWQPQPQPWYPGPAPAQPWTPDDGSVTSSQIFITSSDPEGLSKEEFDQLKLRFFRIARFATELVQVGGYKSSRVFPTGGRNQEN